MDLVRYAPELVLRRLAADPRPLRAAWGEQFPAVVLWVDISGFTPLIWAGGGFFHLDARGDLPPPRQGGHDEVWAGALELGAGIGYRLVPELMIVTDVAGVLTLPRAAVAISGETIGRTGRPALVGTLGLALRF